MEAISGIDDGAVQPEEGDDGGSNFVEGRGWGRLGGSYVLVWGGNDGIGSTEGNMGVSSEEDLFFPEESQRQRQ